MVEVESDLLMEGILEQQLLFDSLYLWGSSAHRFYLTFPSCCLRKNFGEVITPQLSKQLAFPRKLNLVQSLFG